MEARTEDGEHYSRMRATDEDDYPTDLNPPRSTRQFDHYERSHAHLTTYKALGGQNKESSSLVTEELLDAEEPRYLMTPYYRLRAEVELNPQRSRRDNDGTLKYNYSPYDLFVIKTRLEPFIQVRLDPRILIRFVSRYLNDRMRMTIELWRGDEAIVLNDRLHHYLQQVVDYITSNYANHCLLLVHGLSWNVNRQRGGSPCCRAPLPQWWVNSTLPFLGISPHFQPQYRPPSEYSLGGVLVDLSKAEPYSDIYRRMLIKATDRLTEMYQLGFLSLPSDFDNEALARWQVSSIFPLDTSLYEDIKQALFRADWADNRLTEPVGGMIAFLEKHLIRGSSMLWLRIGRDIEPRYQVTRMFRRYGLSSLRYRFLDDMVEVDVADLDEARIIAGLVQEAKTIIVESMITIQFADRDWYNVNLALLSDLSEEAKIEMGLVGLKIMGYMLADDSYPYCLALEIPTEAEPNFYYEVVRLWILDRLVQYPITTEPSLTLPTREELPAPGEELITPDLRIGVKKFPEPVPPLLLPGLGFIPSQLPTPIAPTVAA